MSTPPSDEAMSDYVEDLLDATRAEEDPLTGLPNRAGLLRALDTRRAQRVPTAVAVLGLDNFLSLIHI